MKGAALRDFGDVLRRAWRAVGGQDASVADGRITGARTVLPSVFDVTGLAMGAVAAATVAAAELHAARRGERPRAGGRQCRRHRVVPQRGAVHPGRLVAAGRVGPDRRRLPHRRRVDPAAHQPRESPGGAALLPETTLGKRCTALDLRSGEGRDRFEELVADADVLVVGLRPDALAGLPEQDGAATADEPRLEPAATAWGPARRVPAPGRIDGIPTSWPVEAGPLGGHRPAWDDAVT